MVKTPLTAATKDYCLFMNHLKCPSQVSAVRDDVFIRLDLSHSCPKLEDIRFLTISVREKLQLGRFQADIM